MKGSILKKAILMGLICGNVLACSSVFAAAIRFYGSEDYSTVSGGLDLSGKTSGITIDLTSATQATITYGTSSFNVIAVETSKPTTLTQNQNWNKFTIAAVSTDGCAGDAVAKVGNIVIVSGADVGVGEFKKLFGGMGETGAYYNKVIVESSCMGTFKGDIYGGYVGNGNANYNMVEINGGTFTEANIYGGFSEGTGDVKTGNTFVIGAKDITVKSVQNFQNYTFNLANIAKDETMLTVTDTTGIDMAGNTIAVNTTGTALKKEDTVTLIHMTNNDATAVISNLATAVKMTDGIVDSEGLIYGDEGTAAAGYKKLMFKMGETSLNEEGSKAPLEGMATASAMINSSSDLAMGAGMVNLLTGTAATGGMETFGVSNFGKARYNTGSHVDANGYSLMVGVGKKAFDKDDNKTTGGLYFEYGNSDFDTYNGSITGSGKNIYKGVGYMMRWDNKNGNYYEGMLHGGKLNTTWGNSTGNYDVSPAYFGGAVTYGHKFMMGEKKQLSVYGTYSYTRTGGADAQVGSYDYDFNATNSHRTRVGVRYALSDLMDTAKFRPYAGLVWEHEFDGETMATVKGFGEAPSPSMKGDSGILELGCSTEVGKWTLGIGADVFTGKRRGWNGTLQAVYNF